ncbi:microphthalmia-associated transcription factor, partial [Clonorchis sinensis]
MMTNIGEMDEDLDEGVVADHLRGTDVNRYPEHNYLTFTNFEKADANWTNLMSRQKTSIEETSPQTSHLSPEPNSISDLASPVTGSGSIINMVEQPSSTDLECLPLESNFVPPVSTFEYNQRLPSLESSSSASIGRSASGLTSQSLFAWQPFGGATIVHPHSQASSLHSAGGHLFPLVSGSSISGTYGTDFPNLSPSSGAGIAIPSHDKADSQFNPLSYANVSAAIAASGRLRASVSSPTAQDLQPLRMEMGLSGANPLTIATPIPTYAPSAGSSNSQSSTPAHQGFTFTPNGGGSSAASSSVPQQLSTGNLSNQPYDDVPKSMNFKQRSKKESHNRIERKRRDYINSQIVYLSSLLPPELYRDVDGRRNKGSVLRLSVNYIKDLREAVSHMSALKQENTLARQVIPLLRKRIEV